MVEMQNRQANYLIKSLKNLKNDPCDFTIEDVLMFTFDIGRMNCIFKQSDQELIGSLINDSIKQIDKWIFKRGNRFDRNNAPYNLMLRSGIQFMLDSFKDFTVCNNEKLQDTFKLFKETQSIEKFDEALQNWKISNATPNEDDFIFTLEELSRPQNVPESHHWWL
ncbi:unnamed protein product [Brachionus calyciflorus]|uniref:Uncharacterized protein n=1 Tax=Brachionus calyciflorus TaxID=104777 RepID=A0A813XLD0_9BILA|nr:unnamed protein product [Brachionus calyciflorus]